MIHINPCKQKNRHQRYFIAKKLNYAGSAFWRAARISNNGPYQLKSHFLINLTYKTIL